MLRKKNRDRLEAMVNEARARSSVELLAIKNEQRLIAEKERERREIEYEKVRMEEDMKNKRERQFKNRSGDCVRDWLNTQMGPMVEPTAKKEDGEEQPKQEKTAPAGRPMRPQHRRYGLEECVLEKDARKKAEESKPLPHNKKSFTITFEDANDGPISVSLYDEGKKLNAAYTLILARAIASTLAKMMPSANIDEDEIIGGILDFIGQYLLELLIEHVFGEDEDDDEDEDDACDLNDRLTSLLSLLKTL